MERVNALNPQQVVCETEARVPGWQGPAGLMHADGAVLPPTPERWGENPPRAALSGDLWMVDHNGATVLRCQCLAVSATRMRLCVPVGYGVAVGQRYELGARCPGEHSPSPFPAILTCWVTVLQTQSMTNKDPDRIDVAVAVDQMRPAPLCSLPRALS